MDPLIVARIRWRFMILQRHGSGKHFSFPMVGRKRLDPPCRKSLVPRKPVQVIAKCDFSNAVNLNECKIAESLSERSAGLQSSELGADHEQTGS